MGHRWGLEKCWGGQTHRSTPPTPQSRLYQLAGLSGLPGHCNPHWPTHSWGPARARGGHRSPCCRNKLTHEDDDSCFVTETSSGGWSEIPPPTSRGLEDVVIVLCILNGLTHVRCLTDQNIHACTHISLAVVTSPLAVSLNTGSSLHAHCCLCRNDWEISGLGVILCLSHKPRHNITRALWRYFYGDVYCHPFRSGSLSTFSLNCQAMIWIQVISSGIDHVLEHLAIPEENVVVQRLLFQSSCKRPNWVSSWLHLHINFDTNETIHVIQYKYSVVWY